MPSASRAAGTEHASPYLAAILGGLATIPDAGCLAAAVLHIGKARFLSAAQERAVGLGEVADRCATATVACAASRGELTSARAKRQLAVVVGAGTGE